VLKRSSIIQEVVQLPRTHRPKNISISPFLLLQAIQDGRLRNYRDVDSLLHGGWLHARYKAECKRAIKGFERLDLIILDDQENFQITSKVEEYIEAFDLSPSQMSVYGRDSLVVNPAFPRPKQAGDLPEVFVLMPFKPELRPIYDRIRSVTEKQELSIARADDFFSSDTIVEEVWDAINAARVIIADCTSQNPNVFYEIGIAHTLGKPVISISQTLDDVPFDVKHRRAIIYELTPSGITNFEQSLAKTLEFVLLNHSSVEVANDILNMNRESIDAQECGG